MTLHQFLTLVDNTSMAHALYVVTDGWIGVIIAAVFILGPALLYAIAYAFGLTDEEA